MSQLTVVEPGTFGWSNPGALPVPGGNWNQFFPGRLPPKLMPMDAGLDANITTQHQTNPFQGFITELDQEILYQQALVRQNAAKYALIPDGDILHWKTYAYIRGQNPPGPDAYCTWFANGKVYVSEHYHQNGATFEDELIDNSKFDYAPCANNGDPGRLLISYPTDPTYHWMALDGVYQGQVIQGPYRPSSGTNVLAGSVDDHGDEHPPVPPLMPPPPALPDGLPEPPPLPPFQLEADADQWRSGDIEIVDNDDPEKNKLKPENPTPGDPDPRPTFKLKLSCDLFNDCPPSENTAWQQWIEYRVINILQNAPGSVPADIINLLSTLDPPPGWGGGDTLQQNRYSMKSLKPDPLTGRCEYDEVDISVPGDEEGDFSPAIKRILQLLEFLVLGGRGVVAGDGGRAYAFPPNDAPMPDTFGQEGVG